MTFEIHVTSTHGKRRIWRRIIGFYASESENREFIQDDHHLHQQQVNFTSEQSERLHKRNEMERLHKQGVPEGEEVKKSQWLLSEVVLCTVKRSLAASCFFCRHGKKNGAPGGDRTHDPLLRRQLLYPLSYQGNQLYNLTHFLLFSSPILFVFQKINTEPLIFSFPYAIFP